MVLDRAHAAIEVGVTTDYIDEVICLSVPTNFRAVGQFYQYFDQVDDLEVKALLNKSTVS